MKYVIIIPDGAADHPLEVLDGKTPFEVAHKPHTDRISSEGCQGTVVTTPAGFPCGSDVCTMSLLGYDPAQYHTGRAPLEAASLGIDMAENDWIFRVNLVTVASDCMADHSAGHISSRDGRRLLIDIAAILKPSSATLYPGVSYRNIMVDRSDRDFSSLATTPPHDIPGLPIQGHLPTGGPEAQWLRELIERSAEVLADHEVNHARREAGQPAATHLWPWGQGRKPAFDTFEQRFGLGGAMITAVDLLGGLAVLMGWQRLDVPGQTSYHDTDYAAAGKAAINAIDRHDMVCVHIEAPDEASHAADAATKVASIEAIDRHVVGPVHSVLRGRGSVYRLLYLPDHYTAVSTRKHDPTPVPFAMCGSQIDPADRQPFNETNARQSSLHVARGHELMAQFLLSA